MNINLFIAYHWLSSFNFVEDWFLLDKSSDCGDRPCFRKISVYEGWIEDDLNMLRRLHEHQS